jgi:AcrR family transcriptional regulator
MAQKMVDRRVEKTKKALKDALICLAQDQSFESISIQEILDRANVGRSTFYIHYQNKYELLHDCFQDFSRLLEAGNQTSQRVSAGDFLLDLFRFIEENRALVKAFLGKEGIALLNQPIVDLAHDQMKLSLSNMFSNNKRTAVPVDLAVLCFASELIGTLRWWLYNGTDCSADEMNGYFQNIAFGGLKDALGADTTRLFR